MSVVVSRATLAERDLIAGLFQFYIYDFSAFEPPGSTRLDFDAMGRFEAFPYLDAYWGAGERWPFLLRVEGRAAGFALINRETHSGAPADWNMAEFFVARKFRGRGLGNQAARQLFREHPGQWEVAVADRNPPALRFWPEAIRAAGVSNLVCVESGVDARWTGPIWRFHSKPG